MPVVALLVGAGAGLATGLAATDLSLGNLGGALVLGLMLGVYGLVSRHLKPIRVRDKVVDLPRHGRIRPAGLESDTV